MSRLRELPWTATVTELLNILVSVDFRGQPVADTNFVMAFLLNYILFTSPEHVLDRLAIELEPSKPLSFINRCSQINVMLILKEWISNFFSDFKRIINPGDFPSPQQVQRLAFLRSLVTNSATQWTDSQTSRTQSEWISAKQDLELAFAKQAQAEPASECFSARIQLLSNNPNNPFFDLTPCNSPPKQQKKTSLMDEVRGEDSDWTNTEAYDTLSELVEELKMEPNANIFGLPADEKTIIQIHNISSSLLVDQLTLIDGLLLKNLRLREFIRKRWTRQSDPNGGEPYMDRLENVEEYSSVMSSRNILRMVQVFNYRILWVASEILKPERLPDRQALVLLFIECVIKFRRHNNFFAVASLVAGLEHSALIRIKSLFAAVPPKLRKMYEAAAADVAQDRDFKLFRTCFAGALATQENSRSETVGSCVIPHLLVLCKDLYLLEDHPVWATSREEGIVNFFKFQKQWQHLSNLVQCQQTLSILFLNPPALVQKSPDAVVESQAGGSSAGVANSEEASEGKAAAKERDPPPASMKAPNTDLLTLMTKDVSASLAALGASKSPDQKELEDRNLCLNMPVMRGILKSYRYLLSEARLWEVSYGLVPDKKVAKKSDVEENRLFLEELQKRLTGDRAPKDLSDRPHRRFLVKEGSLTRLMRRRTEIYYFHLLSDMLIYSEIGTISNVYKVHGVFFMSELGVAAGESDVDIQLCSPKKSFLVRCDTVETRSMWLEALQNTLEEAMKTKEKLVGADASTGPTIVAPVWMQDNTKTNCVLCDTLFTTFVRRHHCRQCGRLVCNTCSPHRIILGHVHRTQTQRVCTSCFQGANASSIINDSDNVLTSAANADATSPPGHRRSATGLSKILSRVINESKLDFQTPKPRTVSEESLKAEDIEKTETEQAQNASVLPVGSVPPSSSSASLSSSTGTTLAARTSLTKIPNLLANSRFSIFKKTI